MKSATIFRPTSTHELSEFINAANKVRISGYWNCESKESQFDAEIELHGNSGVIEFSPSDQVVKLRSGTTIGELNSELSKAGQTIPIFESKDGEPWGAWESQLVADCLAWNLPHGLESQHGTWRDWILGATIVLANGMIFKSGSSVVKSVAGYDLHRLMLGARHTLGVVAEVTMRTTPLSTLRTSEIEVIERHEKTALTAWRIQRCLKSKSQEMRDGLADSVVAFDPLTCTAFSTQSIEPPLRIDSDWILETGQLSFPLNPAQADYMMRAKQIFDPTSKLSPGEMGIF